jgi:hypothetical protein
MSGYIDRYILERIQKQNEGYLTVLCIIVTKITEPSIGYPSDQLYLIDEIVENDKRIKWAIDNSISGRFVKEVQYNDCECGVGERLYQLCVYLDEECYLVWELGEE